MVVLAAAALFAIPSLLLWLLPAASLPAFLAGTTWTGWLHRALVFLVISCPCALVISVPLSFFGGIGGAGKCGILIKGGNYLEALAKADTVIFDKTGTLTEGVFSVTAVHPEGDFDPKTLLEYAALAESWSDPHLPIPQGGPATRHWIPPGDGKQRKSGMGVRATVDGRHIAVGNSRLMECERVMGGFLETAGHPGTCHRGRILRRPHCDFRPTKADAANAISQACSVPASSAL